MPDAANAIFAPFADADDPEETLRQALAVIDAFTDRFNSRDVAGMDALLHFPHVIMAGERLVVWERPGQLPPTFFDDLAATGWVASVYLEKRAVLVSADKIHLVVIYTRNRADGSVITRHENLWIITNQDGHWGIKERSY